MLWTINGFQKGTVAQEEHNKIDKYLSIVRRLAGPGPLNDRLEQCFVVWLTQVVTFIEVKTLKKTDKFTITSSYEKASLYFYVIDFMIRDMKT